MSRHRKLRLGSSGRSGRRSRRRDSGSKVYEHRTRTGTTATGSNGSGSVVAPVEGVGKEVDAGQDLVVDLSDEGNSADVSALQNPKP